MAAINALRGIAPAAIGAGAASPGFTSAGLTAAAAAASGGVGSTAADLATLGVNKANAARISASQLSSSIKGAAMDKLGQDAADAQRTATQIQAIKDGWDTFTFGALNKKRSQTESIQF